MRWLFLKNKTPEGTQGDETLCVEALHTYMYMYMYIETENSVLVLKVS